MAPTSAGGTSPGDRSSRYVWGRRLVCLVVVGVVGVVALDPVRVLVTAALLLIARKQHPELFDGALALEQICLALSDERALALSVRAQM